MITYFGRHAEFMAKFPHASADAIFSNCGPYPFRSAATPGARPPEPDAPTEPSKGLRASKRIRQSSKPLLNKLETEWLSRVKMTAIRVQAHALTFRLGNGVKYSPDIFGIKLPGSTPTCWEVKGPWMTDDAVVKIKVAAKEYPDFDWVLVWKGDDGQWKEQKILA